MRRLLLLALAWLLPSLASAQVLVGGNPNLLTDAESLGFGVATTAWGLRDGATVTANYAPGPGSSGMVAVRVVFPGWGSVYVNHTFYTGIVASSVYDLSVYLTPTSAGSTNSPCVLQYGDSGGYHNITLTYGTWTRVEVLATSTSGSALSFDASTFKSGSSTGTCDFLAYGAKIELGSTATGTYPTAATPDTYFWGGRWGFLRGSSAFQTLVAAPTFSPVAGTYTSTQSVTANSSTSGATIYTGQTSPPANASATFTASASGTWYAQAKKAGMTDSAISSASYTIGGFTGSWVSAAGTACTNGSALVPDANACEWQPCMNDPLPSVVYYVCNTGGDDTRTAAQARDPTTPWATSAKAQTYFASLNAGEALAFCRGGTFTTPGGQWQNYNGTQANPTIVRDYVRPGRAGLGDPRPIFNGEQFTFGIYPGQVKFENLAMHASTGSSSMMFFFDDTSNVTACNLEVAGAGIGFEYAHKNLPPNVYNNAIVGCRVLNNQDQGYIGDGRGTVITDNWFYNNPTVNNAFNHSIYIGGHSFNDEANWYGNEYIARNEIHPVAGATGLAITIEGIHKSTTLENNRIIFDLGTAAAGGWGIQAGGTGYSDLIYVQDLVIRGNTIINPGNQGIGVATCKSNCLVENNLVVNTQQSGTGIAAPNQSNGYGIVDTAITVRNNTVYLPVTGSTGIRTGYDGASHVVANNVVQAPTCYFYEGAAGAYIERDYNACYVGSDTPVGTHSFTANPLWVNPTSAAGYNFKPGAGSPLISAGDSTQNPGIDLTGATRPTTPSVGAYEP